MTGTSVTDRRAARFATLPAGASGTYVPAIQGREPSDSGQFGLAFRFPVEKINTEIGLYAMNIHSRLPVAASITGTNWKDLRPRSRPH